MACERYREALADLAAGGRPAAGVESHLTSCESCREELAARRRALALADSEMAGLLSAEPSPDLAARIRRDAAASATVPDWRFGWLWPAMAAAIPLLVALAVWQGRGPSRPKAASVAVVPSESAPPAPEGPTSASTRPGDSVAERRLPKATRPPRSQGGPRLATVATPEVLVPPGEREALLRLVALVHGERLTPVGLGAAGQASPELAELTPLEIRPLEIVPLEPAETSGT